MLGSSACRNPQPDTIRHTMNAVTGRRKQPPAETSPPTPEQILLAAERTARWGKVAVAALTSLAGGLTFLAVTGAAIMDVPRRQNAMEARQDTFAVQQAKIQEKLDTHVQREAQQTRAMVCALKRIADDRDASACLEFLPDPPGYYEPPAIR